MPSLFEAYITNLGKYTEGKMVGETLKFPTTTEEVQALLKRIGVDGVRYLFILWAFLKLGTAYRLAPGVDFAHKLIGLGQTIGPAFADFAPGLHPFDWLGGIAGGAALRLVV